MNALAEAWFVSDGRETFGPLARADLVAAMDQGTMAASTWVRRADWDEWRTASEVQELARELSAEVAYGQSGVRRTSDAVVSARELALVVGAESFTAAVVHVLDASVRHLGCAGGLVHERDGRRFVTRGAAGQDAARALHRTMRTGDAVIVELQKARFVREHKRTRARLTRAGVSPVDSVALPLRARAELVGVIELATDARRGPFEMRDIAFVEQVAAGLALAAR